MPRLDSSTPSILLSEKIVARWPGKLLCEDRAFPLYVLAEHASGPHVADEHKVPRLAEPDARRGMRSIQDPTQHLGMHRSAGELTPDITATVHNLIKTTQILHPHSLPTAPSPHDRPIGTRPQRVLIQCAPRRTCRLHQGSGLLTGKIRSQQGAMTSGLPPYGLSAGARIGRDWP